MEWRMRTGVRSSLRDRDLGSVCCEQLGVWEAWYGTYHNMTYHNNIQACVLGSDYYVRWAIPAG